MKYEIVIVKNNENVLQNNNYDRCIFKSEGGWGTKVKFKNCDVSRCIFTNIYPSFDSKCSIENNIYTSEYDDKSILADVYVNDLPEGDIIGYKKVYIPGKIDKYGDMHYIELICKLLIPAKSKRTRGVTRKCRTNRAKVLGLYLPNGNRSRRTLAFSDYDTTFKYKVGKFVKPKKPFTDNPLDVCSSGIHFFTKFEEAVNY